MGQSPSVLVDASKAKNKEGVDEILSKKEQIGIDINYCDEEGKTALHWACTLGQIDIISALLQAGVNSEKTDIQGCTPLTAAVFMGQNKSAELLIDRARVSLDVPNKDGMTPLHWAVSEKHYECVELLIKKGASLSFKNNKGQTPVEMCSRLKAKQRVKMENHIVQCIEKYRSAKSTETVREVAIMGTEKVDFNVRIRRLVVLCKIWGLAKFMHPYLVHKKDVDWDQSLIKTIPKISAASSSLELQNVMNGLLSELGDNNTYCYLPENERKITEIPRSYDDSSLEQPCVQVTSDNIAVLVVTHHEKFQDYQKMMMPFINCFKDINQPKVEGVIFDVRLKKGSSINTSYPFKFMFYEAFRSTLLDREVSLSAFRHRIFTGYPQQKNFGNVFHSGMVTIEGEQVHPNIIEDNNNNQNGAKKNWVFILNKGTPDTVVDLAVALQTAGLARIVVEKMAGDVEMELGISTFLVSIGENLTVSIRKNERVNADGSLGLVPDSVISVSAADVTDLPLESALEISRNFNKDKDKKPDRTITKAQVYIKRTQDKEYAEMQYPNLEYRLLALFRFWNIIQYFFPYKNLTDKNWDDILVDFIPKLESAHNALEYHLAIAELVSHCCDSHSSLSSPIINTYVGTHSPPIEVKLLEGKTIITHIFDPSIQQQFGIYPGDEIIGVDNQTIEERKKKLSNILPASTKQALNLKIHQKLLAGEKDSTITLKVRGANGNLRDISMVRSTLPYPKPSNRLSFSVLSEGFGFIDTVNLNPNDFEKAFETIKDTPALILDIRGYPKGTIYQLAPRLTDKKVTVAITNTPLFLPSMIYADLESCAIQEKHKLQPSNQSKYKGKIVALINEETQSHAEHSCLYLSACTDGNVTFVGSPTNGANGNVTNCSLPGGILVGFTGLGTLHGNKDQLQRKGIQPHVFVEPTIEGLRRNIDVVFNKAVEYLTSNNQKEEK